MFKKLLVVSLVACMALFAGNAYAWGDWGLKTASAEHDIFSHGPSEKIRHDDSLNDFANAGAGSYGIAMDEGKSGIIGFGVGAQSYGEVDSHGDSGAFAMTLDFGKSSLSLAGSDTTVHVLAEGTSKFNGFGIGGAYNKSSGEVEGGANQNNQAGELGYQNNQGVYGYNTSEATFNGSVVDQDFALFCGRADTSIDMKGKAQTFGESFAKIDPDGNKRSIFAETANWASANVTGNTSETNTVTGSGIVSGLSQMPGAAAGGYAGFTYNGTSSSSIQGQGGAYIQANTHNGGDHFSSTAKAGAFSSVD